jgi:hypothetical protein
LGRDIRFVGEEVNLPTDRIQRPQHVETLPSRGRAYEHPRKTPQGTQERTVNKVRGIYEKHHSLARLRFRQLGLEVFLETPPVRPAFPQYPPCPAQSRSCGTSF